MSQVQLSQETEQKIQDWATKTGRKAEDLKTVLLRNYQQLEKIPTLTAQQKEIRARAMTYAGLKREILSPSVPFTVVWIGTADNRDTTEYNRRMAMEAYQRDPKKAVDDWVTNAAGVPLDTREYFDAPKNTQKNPNFKKPIKPFFQKTVVGFGFPYLQEGKEGQAKLIHSQFRNEQAALDIPFGVALDCRLNIKAGLEPTEPDYIVNSSATTKFEPTKYKGQIPSLWEILDIHTKTHHVLPGDIKTFYEANKDSKYRLVVTEGDVVQVRREPLQRKDVQPAKDFSYFMVLDDESLGFETAEGKLQTGIPIFAPLALAKHWDFGTGSRVVVVGQVNLTAGYDPETRAPVLDDQGKPIKDRVAINAYGVWPRPEFKTSPSEEHPISSAEEIS